jgi:3-oxoacyl-[acyl-carrier protein] reductase
MDFQLTGRNALVTGGSRGIGRAIVLGLARSGANVVTCYRTESESVQSLARELKETPGEHHLMQADVTDPVQVKALLEECGTRLGSLQAVVNNAGVISNIPFDKLPIEEWHRILDTHLTGAFSVVQQSLPLLGEGSSIVNIGSRVATIGTPARVHYCTAKAGFIGFSRSLARELGRRGIRVNLVEPGVIETEEALKLTPEQYQAAQARYQAITSLGRLGTPEELANVVLFLASPLSAYVTGASIQVDGGI